MINYRVKIVESVYGEKDFWYEDFSTYEAAQNRIDEINQGINYFQLQDIYRMANPTVLKVEVPLVPQGYISNLDRED